MVHGRLYEREKYASVLPVLGFQDCVTIEGLDTVLLRPPSSPAVSARFSTDRALPQAGQRFRFSKVGVFGWNWMHYISEEDFLSGGLKSFIISKTIFFFVWIRLSLPRCMVRRRRRENCLTAQWKTWWKMPLKGRALWFLHMESQTLGRPSPS